MQGEGFLLTIAQAPSYIPGGGRSFWMLIGFLLLVIGFLIALWLIWIGLRWIIEKIAAAFRKKGYARLRSPPAQRSTRRRSTAPESLEAIIKVGLARRIQISSRRIAGNFDDEEMLLL